MEVVVVAFSVFYRYIKSKRVNTNNTDNIEEKEDLVGQHTAPNKKVASERISKLSYKPR
jgi:hypothetical protein